MVTTAVLADGTVQVDWVAPHDGYSTISGYLIEVADTINGWHDITSFCNTQLLKCVIEMETLQAAPYSLPFDALVQVRVTAANSYGPALLASATNTVGARVRQVPDQMSKPTLVFGTDYTVQVEWLPLTDPATGNSPVVSYNLVWDNGSGATTISLCDLLVTQFTVT